MNKKNILNDFFFNLTFDNIPLLIKNAILSN